MRKQDSPQNLVLLYVISTFQNAVFGEEKHLPQMGSNTPSLNKISKVLQEEMVRVIPATDEGGRLPGPCMRSWAFVSEPRLSACSTSHSAVVGTGEQRQGHPNNKPHIRNLVAVSAGCPRDPNPSPQKAVEENVTQHKSQGRDTREKGNQGREQSGVSRTSVSSLKAGGQAQRCPG